jgi:hypothetical protein
MPTSNGAVRFITVPCVSGSRGPNLRLSFFTSPDEQTVRETLKKIGYDAKVGTHSVHESVEVRVIITC